MICERILGAHPGSASWERILRAHPASASWERILGAQASCLPCFLCCARKRIACCGSRQGCLRSQAGFLPVLETGC